MRLSALRSSHHSLSPRAATPALIVVVLIVSPWVAPLAGQQQEKKLEAAAQEHMSRLSLFAPKDGADERAVFFLDQVKEPLAIAGAGGPTILRREIFRQAILMAIRDGLGQGTRDAALREPPPDGRPKLTLECSFSVWTGRFAGLRLQDEHGKVLTKQELKLPAAEGADYLEMLRWAEGLTRKELRTALKEAGITDKSVAARAHGAIPREAEKFLPRMNFLAQVTTLRALHDEVRKRGESPELLGALVQGYAHLGILTEYHWNTSNKVFKARALLYAQRMLARSPDSGWACWHRAYALALTGRHADALRDLDEANKRWTKRKDEGLGQPAWVEVIDAFCRFDGRRLKAAVADKQWKELALLLNVLGIEWCDCTSLALATMAESLRQMPECFRIQDAAGDYGGVGNLHGATSRGAALFGKVIPVRLREMPGLPERIAKQLEREEPEADVFRGLVEAGRSDVREPSWSVVGRMLQEVRFRQVQRRAEFMRYSWSVPVDEYLQESLPLVAGHPYEKLIRMYGETGPARRKTCDQLLRELPVSELEFPQELLLAYEVERSGAGLGNSPFRIMQLHCDTVYRDFAALLTKIRMPHLYARKLLDISPHSPVAIAALIEYDWVFAQTHLTQWEKEHLTDHPVVQGALGKRYLKLGKPEEAELHLRRYLEASPDPWPYKTLADAYRARGNFEKWQKILDEFLKQEDHGLSHARVRVEMARHFMGRKEWEKARPYAEAAAQTYAGWAMLCAAECCEGLGEWEQAESWTRRASERYADGRLEWFLWCKRTAKGDLKAAERLAAEHIKDAARRGTREDLNEAAVFYELTGKKQEALDAYRRLHRLVHSEYTFVYLALAADAAGARDVRDSAWQDLTKSKTSFGLMARLIRDSLAKGEDAAPAEKEVDEILKVMPANQQGDFHLFLGLFLRLRGRPKEAAEHLRACLRVGELNKTLRAIAVVHLRELEAKP